MNTLPAPTYEPITVAEARLQCRLVAEGSPPSHPEDALLDIYISAAREWAEEYTGVALGGRNLELALSSFPDEITFPVGPLLGVASITYLDVDGDLQTVPQADYVVNPPLSVHTEAPRTVILAGDAEWPDTNGETNNITVTYAVGYSAPGESPQDRPMPKAVKMGLLLLVAHLYKNREDTTVNALQSIPAGAKMFLDTQRERLGFV